MTTVCFIYQFNEVPEEAKNLWKGYKIGVIGKTVFKGRLMHPIIPEGLMNKDGSHCFSIVEAMEILDFIEVRNGLFKGVKKGVIDGND